LQSLLVVIVILFSHCTSSPFHFYFECITQTLIAIESSSEKANNTKKQFNTVYNKTLAQRYIFYVFATELSLLPYLVLVQFNAGHAN